MQPTIVNKTSSFLHNDKVIVINAIAFINVKQNQEGRIVSKMDRDHEQILPAQYIAVLNNYLQKNDCTIIEFYDEESKFFFLQRVPKGKEHFYLLKKI